MAPYDFALISPATSLTENIVPRKCSNLVKHRLSTHLLATVNDAAEDYVEDARYTTNNMIASCSVRVPEYFNSGDTQDCRAA